MSHFAQRTERELVPVADEATSRLPGATVAAFPAVVAVLDGVDVLCSGVLVADRAVLTTADCAFATGDPTNLEVQAPRGGRYEVIGASVSPVVADELSSSLAPALLWLDAAPPGRVLPVISSRPSPSAAAMLVGFGLEAGGRVRTGIKRSSPTVLVDCSEGVAAAGLCWVEPAGLAALPAECRPGGGAALLVQSEGEWRVAASSAPPSSCGGDPGLGADLALHRDWLESELGPSTATGRESSWRLLAAEGSLDPLNREQFFRFLVPPGARSLVISLDGEDGHPFSETAWLPNDFDLYARHGLRPDEADWDCRPFALGSHELCVVERPESGIWYLRAEHFEGAGVLQVTAALRVVDDMLFVDDFETGGLAGWSSLVGGPAD